MNRRGPMSRSKQIGLFPGFLPPPPRYSNSLVFRTSKNSSAVGQEGEEGRGGNGRGGAWKEGGM